MTNPAVVYLYYKGFATMYQGQENVPLVKN